MKLSLNRRTLLALLLCIVAFCGSASHAPCADDNFIIVQSTNLDARLGPVRLHLADLHQKDRNRGSRRGSWHGSGIEECAER
jgi:hypothetical protein